MVRGTFIQSDGFVSQNEWERHSKVVPFLLDLNSATHTTKHRSSNIDEVDLFLSWLAAENMTDLIPKKALNEQQNKRLYLEKFISRSGLNFR